MTVAAKENIPLVKTATNFLESSPSSTTVCFEAMETSVMVKDDIAIVVKDDVTTDGTSVEYTDIPTSTERIAEESVHTKRPFAETLSNAEQNSNAGIDCDDNIITNDSTKDQGDKETNERITEATISIETTNVNGNTTTPEDEDQHAPKQPHHPLLVSDVGNHNPAATDAIVAVTTKSSNVSNEEAPPIGTSTIDLQRPVKRARTAYFLFLDDFRSTVQKENPGASVATIARILGQRWSAMSDDDKQPYQARAIVERERVTAATEAWKKAAAVAAGKNITTTSRMMNRNNLDDSIRDTNKTRDNGLAAMVLPVGRVRKICRLDPDVRGISKEALLLITKATEMVTVQLGQECIKTAHIQNRRTLLPQDVVDVCNIRESFFFLKDDITDLHRQQQKLLQAKSHQNGGVGTQRRGSSHGSSSSSTVAATSKTLTDYFKPLT